MFDGDDRMMFEALKRVSKNVVLYSHFDFYL